ncbi:MAG TPA: lysophospholipid acyltransferase family protein [Chthoniobacterales bacterium]
MIKATPAPVPLPPISRRLVRLFTRYARGYMRRHLHAVRLLSTHALPADFSQLPVVVFLNHASWWDPLTCLVLADKFFPTRRSYAPIDARALRRYPFLGRLGFFPVEMGSARGAAAFLQEASAIVESRERMLWITPQGKFTDARARPVSLERGLAHLAGRAAAAVFLPLAIEYTFWEERTPEVLLAFGTPLFTQQHGNSCGADDWAGALERTLEDAQNALAAAAQRRQPDEWQLLLRGAAGTTPIYDAWRRVRAAVRRERFEPEHSNL